MPHLHIEEFKNIEYPATREDVKFGFLADNVKYSEKLIEVEVEEDKFFLLLKEDGERTILKTDKLTRPASIYNVHKALLAYAKEADLNVLSSNVPDNQKNVHLQEVEALKTIGDFAEKFPTGKKVRIEIGFGSGRHLLHQAKNNPDILFIGIEIHRPSIEQVLKQVNIQELDNIMVLDYDARLFMELIPSNVIDKIYVHFPVPWDKKPHRRVISTTFIEEAIRVLEVGGKLELRTDSENYYAYSYETFIAFNKISLEIKKNRDIAITSKYEDRWRKMEKNIYDVTMTNEEESEPLNLEGGFDFVSTEISESLVEQINGSTKRFEGGFIHFERAYKLEDSYMLRVSMGSFDRPEHLYVLAKGEKLEYFPKLPLRSRSNLIAHKLLDGVLHG